MRKPFPIIYDGIRLLKCLTFKRFTNLIWVALTYQIAIHFKRIMPTGGPVGLSVEPTTHCNLRCSECPSGQRAFSRPTGSITTDNFEKWIHHFKRSVVWLNLYFQGEPLLHGNFIQMVRIAKEHQFYTMTSTNGHFLNKDLCSALVSSGLDRIVISLDGLDQESYESYRKGGSLAKVLEGIDCLTAMKRHTGSKHPYVVIQFLVLKSNEHQISSIKKMINQPGVDEIQLKSAQFYDYEHGHPLMPETDQYSRYKKLSDGRYDLKNRFMNKCRRLWYSCVVTWDGQMIPCCYDKDADYPMGSLETETMKAIWKGAAYQRFRKKLFTDRKGIPICTNCSEGTRG